MVRFFFDGGVLKIIVAVLLVLLPLTLSAQETKPKVALVLSGGGAKGNAHIPLLQTLDSLNIVPDLIIGTSMGSVVGGLYAMGYSGDSIANLMKTLRWEKLIGGKISLNNVGVEEKSEDEKYLLGFDLVKGSLSTNSYLLSDQYLRALLNNLTFPVNNITDFDELSIPFRAIATDIVNSKQEIIGKGSLSLAMRASMSIPGAFEPTKYMNTLLVDGGILNNFPTDIAKSMGADIIIGSDVSGYGKPIEELNNFANVVFQTTMMVNYGIYPENRKLATVLVDHVPNLTYATADFKNSNEIYEEGKIALVKNVGQLARIAEILKPFQQRPRSLPYLEDKIVFDSIVFKDISETNLALVKERANLKTNKIYTREGLTQAVKKVIGTHIFRKITLEEFFIADKRVLLFTGFEKSANRFGASLHHDSYRGVGFVANYTGRNVLGSASRLLFSIDIAEQPKVMLQYQKNFGKRRQWWWNAEVQGMKLKQKLFIDGSLAENLKVNSYGISGRINKNINSLHSYIGFGINYGDTQIKPSISPDVSDNVLDLVNYDSKSSSLDARYVFNTMNEVFYPTEGSMLTTILTQSIQQDINLAYTNETISGRTNGFTKLQFGYQKRVPFKSTVTGILKAAAGVTFDAKLQSDEVSFFEVGYSELYFIGGNLPIQNAGSFAFQGLNEDELAVSQFLMLNLGLQLNPINNFYITPEFNLASVGFDDVEEYTNNILAPKGSWQAGGETSLLLSTGVTLAYKSILGPIEFNTSWINDSNDVRFFLSIGIPFNR